MPEIENLKTRSERLAIGARITEFDRLFFDLEQHLDSPDEQKLSAVSLLVTDSILDWDEAALDFAMGQLQRLAALATNQPSAGARRMEGRMLSLLDVTRSGIQRVLPMDVMGQVVEPESHAHLFLQEIDRGSRLSNTAIATALGVDDSEISRIGRRFVQSGLARKRRLGRTNEWLITPRGVQVLAVLDAGGVMRPTREHRQLQI